MAQADLPGADAAFNAAQEPVVSVDIGGLPAGVSQAKGKLGFDLYRFGPVCVLFDFFQCYAIYFFDFLVVIWFSTQRPNNNFRESW